MSEVTKELLELVWGTKSMSDTIFCRWTQGTRAGLTISGSLPGLLGVGRGRPLDPSTRAPLPRTGPTTSGTWRLVPVPWTLYSTRAWSQYPAFGTLAPAFCPISLAWSQYLSSILSLCSTFPVLGAWYPGFSPSSVCTLSLLPALGPSTPAPAPLLPALFPSTCAWS